MPSDCCLLSNKIKLYFVVAMQFVIMCVSHVHLSFCIVFNNIWKPSIKTLTLSLRVTHISVFSVTEGLFNLRLFRQTPLVTVCVCVFVWVSVCAHVCMCASVCVCTESLSLSTQLPRSSLRLKATRLMAQFWHVSCKSSGILSFFVSVAYKTSPYT